MKNIEAIDNLNEISKLLCFVAMTVNDLEKTEFKDIYIEGISNTLLLINQKVERIIKKLEQKQIKKLYKKEQTCKP